MKDSDGSIYQPAFVRKYLAVEVLLQSPSGSDLDYTTNTVFLAGINWLLGHENKKFFGSNVEVWQKFLPCTQADTFVNMKCRCAYVDHFK